MTHCCRTADEFKYNTRPLLSKSFSPTEEHGRSAQFKSCVQYAIPLSRLPDFFRLQKAPGVRSRQRDAVCIHVLLTCKTVVRGERVTLLLLSELEREKEDLGSLVVNWGKNLTYPWLDVSP